MTHACITSAGTATPTTLRLRLHSVGAHAASVSSETMKKSICLPMLLVSSFAVADKDHQCEIQGTEAGGTRIVLSDNKFVSKGSKNIFDYSKPTKFCPREGSPSNCKESGSWFTLREFVRFKALGNEVICSYRSEEHTSELQSRPHLVCRLLLEKK